MSRTSRTGGRVRWLGVTALVAFGLVVLTARNGRPGGEAPAPPDAVVDEGGELRVRELFAGGRSGEMVTVQGRVDRVLADDDDGSRHQRFIVRLPSGHTLLVAHNIDLAPRVPLEAGDRVAIRGQYEWNERGGVLHWTHGDPDGDRLGGWIELRGDRYR